MCERGELDKQLRDKRRMERVGKTIFHLSFHFPPSLSLSIMREMEKREIHILRMLEREMHTGEIKKKVIHIVRDRPMKER